MLRTILGALGSVLLLAGCASHEGNLVSPEEFAATAVGSREARALRPGDQVSLSVEVSGKLHIPAVELELNYAGSVPAPYIGDIKVGGLTLADARSELEKEYSLIYAKKPFVIFRLADDHAAGDWGFVTVLGQVRNPGRFPLETVSGMNLSEALHEAGGFGDSANMNNIMITRQLAEGEVVQCVVDIKEIGRSGLSGHDLVLAEGDVIYVSERLF